MRSKMVHNQVLTWANEKAAAKVFSGKTAKNSYCQGVAAGLIALAKKEKKEEMRLAIEGEKKRLNDAEEKEQAQIKKEKQRLNNPPPVKPEPRDTLLNGSSSSQASGSRNVKLEDAVDEEDVKPFRNGVKRSGSEEFDDHSRGYGRWTESGLDRQSSSTTVATLTTTTTNSTTHTTTVQALTTTISKKTSNHTLTKPSNATSSISPRQCA